MTTKLLNEFKNSNIKIISEEKLQQYIKFCISKNQGSRILSEDGYSKTAYHHILPRALFKLYSNLKDNPWNGTYLLYSDHYYAHWLMSEAIDNYGQLYAFCSMHNQGIKNGRIQESDLIRPDKFQEKMEESANKHSHWYKDNPDKVKVLSLKIKETRNSEEWQKTIGKEAVKKQLKTKSSEEWKNTIGKQAKENRVRTLLKIEENGNTLAANAASRAAKTMKEVQTNGKTIREIATERSIKTRLEKYGKIGGINEEKRKRTLSEIADNGKTRKQNMLDAQHKTKTDKGLYKIIGEKTKETRLIIGEDGLNSYERMAKKMIKSYNIMRGEDIIESSVTRKFIEEQYSPTLCYRRKNNPMGASEYAKKYLKMKHKEYLIGLYVIKL